MSPELDREKGIKAYAYDPHLDPQLQWAGKAEQTSFEVPTVSLHVMRVGFWGAVTEGVEAYAPRSLWPAGKQMLFALKYHF